MKSESFVVIQGWMCNELNLKSNELLVFALIYGFSQDNASVFSGSRKYIADTFNITLPTVDKTLSSLVEKNLIIKEQLTDANNTLRNYYYVDIDYIKTLRGGSKETLQGVVKKFDGGSKETLHNNIDNITNSNIDNKNNSKELLQNLPTSSKKKNVYQKCLDMINEFTDDLEIRMRLLNYLKFRLEVREKPLYANMWKGMLAKLEKIVADNPNMSYVEVIMQSLERGYLSFYPVSSKINRTDFSDRVETDEDKQKDWRREMEENGKKIEF